jgi:vacuolar-type H+-ATPase subunit D/Vma8
MADKEIRRQEELQKKLRAMELINTFVDMYDETLEFTVMTDELEEERQRLLTALDTVSTWTPMTAADKVVAVTKPDPELSVEIQQEIVESVLVDSVDWDVQEDSVLAELSQVVIAIENTVERYTPATFSCVMESMTREIDSKILLLISEMQLPMHLDIEVVNANYEAKVDYQRFIKDVPYRVRASVTREVRPNHSFWSYHMAVDLTGHSRNQMEFNQSINFLIRLSRDYIQPKGKGYLSCTRVRGNGLKFYFSRYKRRARHRVVNHTGRCSVCTTLFLYLQHRYPPAFYARFIKEHFCKEQTIAPYVEEGVCAKLLLAHSEWRLKAVVDRASLQGFDQINLIRVEGSRFAYRTQTILTLERATNPLAFIFENVTMIMERDVLRISSGSHVLMELDARIRIVCRERVRMLDGFYTVLNNDRADLVSQEAVAPPPVEWL